MAERSSNYEGRGEGLRLRRPVLGSAGEVPEKLGFLRAWARASRALSAQVARILREVRRRGDGALLEAVRAYDWPCPGPEGLRVSPQEVEAAWRSLPASRRSALRKASEGIAAFHERQRPPRCRSLRRGGLVAGVETFPLEAVGLYVPGGRAAYPSTLLMLGIPARLAGVERIVVATPARGDGTVNEGVLAAARLLGVQEIWKVGGAAAVAALAFGTETLKPVDKVFGPGNAYVTEAKRQVFGEVGVEALAGPTELVVISDGSAPPAYVAADLLAQAEHDPRASAVLLTSSEGERRAVEGELRRLLARSPRRAVQEESLGRAGALVLCRDLAVAAAAARFLAPEHLAVFTRNPRRWAREVPTAAAVFLGPYSPEAAGDYGAGPNHSLPTSGTARFSSPVSVWDFVRHRSFLQLERGALLERSRWMENLARLEGLFGHALSLEARRRSP